ncbi:Sia1p NDAI_0C01400 [Naumovozyma dairenensis CBS 421]|uniref:Calcineurin-like phosphoesterase domain-containing protein n=1 Tax=Naumovozyma dairenensis (strain ATCC 10597 / BCRC 20456 / CBS 421 / NBRC 0211 / NRRL Y-12639) TaxID=1071378 RepID=G0W7P0_NAUDC|nr:hypothetical protein NDAI_0C01400 [Naumovozyma dairenensis CBS 421]CCD23801.1 hypothetical protein NDAI_0C01400 [Naumovozyma dairenensis CBS 421]
MGNLSNITQFLERTLSTVEQIRFFVFIQLQNWKVGEGKKSPFGCCCLFLKLNWKKVKIKVKINELMRKPRFGLKTRRIFKTIKQLLLLIIFLTIITSWSSIKGHLQNISLFSTRDSTIHPEYEEGPILDIQRLRCYHWYSTCNVLWHDGILWQRIKKDLSDEKLYALESTQYYDSYIYVKTLSANMDTLSPNIPNGSPHTLKRISEIAMSRDPTIIPMQVIRDVNKLFKSSDSSMFHTHVFHQSGDEHDPVYSDNHAHNKNKDIDVHDDNSHMNGYQFLQQIWSWLLAISDSHDDDLSLMGEDWKYRGSGIWCKYENGVEMEPMIVNKLEIYLGSSFQEFRHNWKEIIHEYKTERDERDVSLPISITRQIGRGTKTDPDKIILIEKETEKKFGLMTAFGFKILQVSDLHYKCSDESISNLKEFQTNNFIKKVILREFPNLIVITGDILDGTNCVDYQTCIMKLVQPFINFEIPYLIMLGTSDYSRYASRESILQFIRTLPYCINKLSQNVNDTNVMIPIYNKYNDDDKVNDPYIMIYGVDSFNPIDNTKMKNEGSVKWDYGLAFRSLPIPEYRPEGMFPIVGQYNEKSSLTFEEFANNDDSVDADDGGDGRWIGANKLQDFLISENVQVLSCGHEHSNDCCLQSKNKMWLCYDGSSGMDVARLENIHASVRLFEVDTNAGEITSWKRNSNSIDNVYDYQYIYKKN